METQKSNSVKGISFFGLLAIVFITLKLTHVIAWSWWWVLAPIWGYLAFNLLYFILAFIFFIYDEKRKRKEDINFINELSRKHEEAQRQNKG